MESTRRSKRRSLIRRGWARVKVTVTKWVDGMNEAIGKCRFLGFSKKCNLESYSPVPFCLFSEARRLSQISLDSPLARRTCGCSSTSHLTHPSSSASTLIDPFAEPMCRIESSSIVRIVSHKSLVTPSLVGTSLAAAHSSSSSSSPAPPTTRPRGGTSVSQPPSIPTIAEGSPAIAPSTTKEERRMSMPNPGVQVKTFRRMSLVDGEEIFEEIRPGSGEKKVDFVWGKGVDKSIPPVDHLAIGQDQKSRWRKLSLSKA